MNKNTIIKKKKKSSIMYIKYIMINYLVSVDLSSTGTVHVEYLFMS